jgi:hypothetical protein
MFNSSILDVAIGLAFVYLLLGLMGTTVNEWWAQMRRLRSRTLQEGMLRLLTDPKLSQDFYDHPLIKALMSPDGKHPSYISASTFAHVLIDLVSQGKDDIASLRAGVDGLPKTEIKRALAALIKGTDATIATAQAKIEGWYNDVMDRVSGTYKRKTQVITVIVAFIITIFANADTLQIATRLWTDPTLRAKIVEEAKVRAQMPRPPDQVPEYQNPDNPKPDEPKVTKTAEDKSTITDEDRKALGQLISWAAEKQELEKKGFFEWLGWIIQTHFFGWLLTAIAVSLGAPFWFDTLNKFMNIRSAGKAPKEAPKPPEATKKPDPATPPEKKSAEDQG